MSSYAGGTTVGTSVGSEWYVLRKFKPRPCMFKPRPCDITIQIDQTFPVVKKIIACECLREGLGTRLGYSAMVYTKEVPNERARINLAICRGHRSEKLGCGEEEPGSE